MTNRAVRLSEEEYQWLSSRRKGRNIPPEKQAIEDVRRKRAEEEHSATKRKYEALLSAQSEAEDRLGQVLDLSDSLGHIQPHQISVVASGKRSESTAVLVSSDWHLEEKVDPATVEGLNEYSPKIATGRIEKFFQNGLALIEMARTRSTIDTVVLALIGDLIAGFLHPELVESNYLSPTEALLLAVKLAAGGIDFLLNEGGFNSIIIPCNHGNHGRCHDDKTELLTKRGWKRWDQLVIGEDVATYRMEDGAAQWQPLQDLYFDEYCGEMVRVHTTTADFLVTPRHRMVLRDYHTNRGHIIEMQDLGPNTIGGKWFPKSASGKSRDLSSVSDDELSLLAWVMTDGYHQKHRNGKTDVAIFQSKPAGKASIKSLLDRMGYLYYESTRHRKAPVICGVQVKECLPETRFQISRQNSGRILELAPDKYVLPQWMWRLSARQVRIFLDGLMAGDGAAGSKGNGPNQYTGELHGRREFLDQVQSLLVVNGISSRVRTTMRGDTCLSIRGTNKMFINDWTKSVSRVPYAGIIWCGTVANGTLITRRNGIPLISGNTTDKPRISTAAQNSYEWLGFQFLRQRYEGNPKVRFQIAQGYFNYLPVYGTVIRFHHGDGIKYGGGVGGVDIPLNKAIAQWNKAKHADLDVLGHWHTRKSSRDFVINGSVVGYNAYAIRIKASYEPPCQCFFLVHPERGKTLEAPIFVA